MARRGISIRGRSARIGRLSTQAVRTVVRQPSSSRVASSRRGSNRGRTTNRVVVRSRSTPGNSRSRSTVRVAGRNRSTARTITGALRSASSATRIRPLVSARPALFTRPITSSILRLPLRTTIASVIPRFRFQIPLIIRPRERYSEDVLDISETRIRNNRFEPIEKDGISVFRPEVLSVIDFEPIWKGRSPLKNKRLTRGLTPAGKLIDVQYNSLWLRRDTIINLLNGIQRARRENSNEIFRRLKRDFAGEIARIRRTVNQYVTFIRQAERAKDSLDVRTIPRSAFTEGALPTVDFFNSRMQIDNDEFETYSDTKILMQLLFDYKSVLEDYSFSLLDLVDTDRVNDRSPVKIDRTYTLQDGFTFAISQLRSVSTPQNATQRSYFNSFLGSLPANPDDRVKLLTTVLSKELRVSKGLGRTENQRILQDKFGAGSTGNPFDNIVGIPGDTIFEQPLGADSLQSMLSLPIDENTTILPFERKYVDSEETKKTFVPGTTFFIDTVFELTSNAEGTQTGQSQNFNTRPFVDYVNSYSRKHIQAKQIIESLFELSGRPTNLSPDRMIDSILFSYKRSIEGTATTTGTNRDQAIITALFALANEDNQLKNLLFQYCLLVGLALSTPEDRKPVFNNLARELRTIRSFANVRTSRFTNPNLFGGLRTLRPFIARLALSIENRVFTLTTVTPKVSLGATLAARPDFNRFLTRTTDTTLNKSAFDRLSIRSLRFGETTINVARSNIRNVLMSNLDPRSTATTNLIKEFVDLATRFTNSAAVNGERVYLLDDNSGRTRFNFMSTSTTLLLLFEVISSLVAKYNFSKFGKSQTPFNTFITVDSRTNDYVKDTIEDIISIRPAIPVRSFTLARPPSAYVPLITRRRSSTPFRRFVTTSQTRVRRSRAARRRTSRTSAVGGFLSQLRTGNETALVNQNLSSPFLGRNVFNRLGVIRINELSLSLRTTNLRRSLISIRNKIIDEKRIKENIIDILSTVEKQLRDGENRFVNAFNARILELFLRENSVQDLEIIRNPAQVRLAKVLIDDFTAKRVSGITERRADDRDRIGGGFSRGGITSETSNLAFNFLIDEEVVFPETREALFSLLSEDIFLEPNLADIRTKVMTIGIPAGFVKQLTDRVEQDAINENSFKDKQFDVVSVNVYKRDARFDDIVFKPQSFLFDLSLFEEIGLRGLQVTRNERFDRILQRVRIKDFENLSPWGFHVEEH